METTFKPRYTQRLRAMTPICMEWHEMMEEWMRHNETCPNPIMLTQVHQDSKNWAGMRSALQKHIDGCSNDWEGVESL